MRHSPRAVAGARRASGEIAAVRGTPRAYSAIWCCVLWALLSGEARGQFYSQGTAFELADAVFVDQVSSQARTHLEQARAAVREQQWEEAIESFSQLMVDHGNKLVPLTEDRYLSLRNYCHLQILSLPPAALDLYRQRVDPAAEELYQRGRAQREPRLLREVVDRWFASRWTDDALDVLAELALDEGDYDTARACWQQIIPTAVAGDEPRRRLAAIDTDLDLAEIRAKLIWTSILSGDLRRAERELAAFEQLHPLAEGQLAGRKVPLAQTLRELQQAAGHWPRPAAPQQWQTFAGNAQRDFQFARGIDVGAMAWRQPLEPVPASDPPVLRQLGFRPRRVAEENDAYLSYHPVLYGDVVLYAGPSGVTALEVETGEPAWGQPLIYRDANAPGSGAGVVRPSLGVPRYTLTVSGSRLYARLGSPVTSQATEFQQPLAPGYIVCLDLEAQGSLVWKRLPPEGGWAFEGTPVADGQRLYVIVRRTDVRPQAHVACLDARTGETLWSQLIAAAETPARGQDDEVTHNLLTLHRDTLFISTNLGAIAAVATRDGSIRWLTRYRRASTGDLSRPAAHLYRDLTPCVYHEGTLLVAPSDSPAIMSVDAFTGQLLWSSDYAEDAVHLLGVGGGNLIASGDRLWWIEVDTGRVLARWPDGPSPRGFGRGVLADQRVFWPTREEIFVFDQQTARQLQVLPLTAREPSAQGGNLLMADGHLLISTANRVGGQQLLCFSQYSRPAEVPADATTQGASPAAAQPVRQAQR